MSEEMITISREKYKKLLDRVDFLNVLEAAGVDNWDGYSNAQDILEEWNNA